MMADMEGREILAISIQSSTFGSKKDFLDKGKVDVVGGLIAF